MTDNNSVFLYYIILIFTSGKLFAQSIDCPVQPSITNSEIDRLVSAVSVPDGISELTSKRDMRKLTEDKASSLLSNTTQLNLRVQLENKDNFDKLKKAFSNKGQ
jgi:hypothetical protein